MKAKLELVEATSWRLIGQVEFDTAESFAKALPLDASITQLQINLQQATGGSALLLLLLAWYRSCQALDVQLKLLNPPLQLQKIAELIHLQNLLPLVFDTKEPS